MAATYKDAIENAIKAYKKNNANGVLNEFRSNARIVGSKPHEKWKTRNGARKTLENDLKAFTVAGPLASPSVKLNEFRQLAPGVWLFHRVGSVTFKPKGAGSGKPVQARWTAVVEHDDDKNIWEITDSHFSLDEGETIN